MIFTKQNQKLNKKIVPTNSLIIPVNTKAKFLENISRYPVLLIDLQDRDILVKKEGTLFTVDKQSFSLGDMKLGNLIMKLQSEFNITVSVVYSDIFCEIPSILLQDFTNVITTSTNITKSPLNLEQVLKVNDTVLSENSVDTIKILNSSTGSEESYELEENLLYTKLEFNSNKLFVKTSSTLFYVYFIKDFAKVSEGYITNFGDIV